VVSVVRVVSVAVVVVDTVVVDTVVGKVVVAAGSQREALKYVL
jgi:hypothetical protein